MARKITFREPVETTVRSYLLYRSTTYNGTYNFVASASVTSDGLVKASTNSYVTSTTDANGARTNWYKIRFYDNTNYSDYSDPISSEKPSFLCTPEDVLIYFNYIGRFTDSEVLDAIKVAENNIYIEGGDPIAEVQVDTDSDYQHYYVGEPRIYRVDNVFAGTTTKSEYYQDDSFSVDSKSGIIRLYTTSSTGPDLTTASELFIRYIPGLYNQLCALRASQILASRLIVMNSGGNSSIGATSKELQSINKQLETVESLLQEKLMPILSSDYVNYDANYGINAKRVTQDFTKNVYRYKEPSTY